MADAHGAGKERAPRRKKFVTRVSRYRNRNIEGKAEFKHELLEYAGKQVMKEDACLPLS